MTPSYRIIPTEIYTLILECIDASDHPTLLSLTTSSRALQSEAERILYRDIDTVPRSVQKRVAFVRTVATCPRVARLVRSYSHQNLALPDDHEFWTLLPPAMRAFVNLKKLHVRAHPRSGETAHMSMLFKCTFQLTHLSWSAQVRDQPDLYTLLSAQPLLQSLRVDSHWESSGSPPLLPSMLPNLQSLSGTYNTLRAFSPGRQITTFYWRSAVEEIFRSAIDPSNFQYLHTLTLGILPDELPFSGISPHLPNLIRLHIIDTEPEHLRCLHQITTLEHVRLSADWDVVPRFFHGEDFRELTTRLFSELSRLLIVDRDLSSYDAEGSYERWERASAEPVTVEKRLYLRSEPFHAVAEW